MRGSAGSSLSEKSREAVLWVLLLAFSLAGISRGLWTPDEPREAEMSREMLLSPGIIPTLAGSPFYEKPPLYYWTVAGVFALSGGPSVAAARAVSGGAGFLTLVLVFLWARRVLDRNLAWSAVMMLATSLQFCISTHWVVIDPLLMLVMTLAAWSGWELACDGGWLAFWGLYVALSLALWTKGLIGPVLAGAGLGAFALWDWKQQSWRSLRPFWGGAVLAGALGLLVAAVFLSGGEKALWEWGWVNHVDRFLNPKGTGHAKPIYYYAPVLALAVVPWLVPVLGIFRPALWRTEGPQGRLAKYLGAWLGGGLLILSIASTKRELYLLPLLPLLFLLMALAMGGLAGKAGAGWLKKSLSLTQAALCLVWGVAPGIALAVYQREVGWVAALAILPGLALGVWAVAAVLRERVRQAFFACVACAALAFLVTSLAVAPVVDREKDMAPFLQWVGSQVPPNVSIAVVGADETLRGIIPFTTGRNLVELPEGGTASDGESPEFLLVQGHGEADAQAWLGRGYAVVQTRNFGPRRFLTLFRKTS